MRVATDLVAARESARRGSSARSSASCRSAGAHPRPACCGRWPSAPRVEIIVGLTGSAVGRRARSSRACAGSAPRLDRSSGAAIVPVVGTEVWNASDPDDEVRGDRRGVVDAMRAGVPLERMAVLYASDEPYARLLHEHFNLAEIAHNGATTRSMSESVLGRGLLRIFALADTEFARDDVCGLFAAAPVLDGRGRPFPRRKWERLSRYAGVVRGVDNGARAWPRTRPSIPPTTNDARGSETQVDALRRVRRGPRRRPRSRACAAHVERAGASSRTGSSAASSETRRAASRGRRSRQVAARRVEAVIDRLGTLDSIDPAPTIDVFRRTFELELDAARDRVGSLGDGVLVGSGGRWRSGSTSTACGCAAWPRACSRRSRATIRCSAIASAAALGGELRLRVRPHHRRRTRVPRRARLDQRRAGLHVSRAAICGAAPNTCRRDSSRPRSPRSVPTFVRVASYAYGATHVAFPANRHELEVRAAVGGEQWVDAEPAVARGLELTERAGGLRSSPASTATSRHRCRDRLAV